MDGQSSSSKRGAAELVASEMPETFTPSAKRPRTLHNDSATSSPGLLGYLKNTLSSLFGSPSSSPSPPPAAPRPSSHPQPLSAPAPLHPPS
ncbi:MAG: hypothetical protein Q8P67_07180, partial [archaeon]|nr:hypothetical protein [archaeon]